ncbi:MAG: hypothetical protein HZB55_01835 [Deltaproteobacteria bacterium]|nr:hypothetical protein [Deltaproteobacteria bacterium]
MTRRWQSAALGGLLVVVGGRHTALGGLNPANPGLPTAVNVYGSTSVTKNGLSAMCVDCHTLSPKPNPRGDNPWPGTGGTHFVVWNDGTGFRATRNAVAYFRLTSWPDAFEGSLHAYSKYGDTAAGMSKMISNATNRAATQDTVSGDYAAYEIICESCHNLIVNAAGGNNLLASYREYAAAGETVDDPAKLCEGCHREQAKGTPAHHPLTGGVTHDVPNGWTFTGDQVGPDPIQSTTHSLNAAHALNPPVTASEITYTTVPKGVSCSSCHRVHGAETQTGARVLKRGSSAAPLANVTGKQVNVIYYANIPEPGDAVGQIKRYNTGVPAGLDRQWDVSQTGAKRLVSNADPVCDGCHSY